MKKLILFIIFIYFFKIIYLLYNIKFKIISYFIIDLIMII